MTGKRQVSPTEEDIRKLEKYLRGKDKARQLLVVMFTDLEGSTQLTEQKGDPWWDKVRAKIDKIAIPEIKKRGCLIKKIGDSYMVVFDNASESVTCALELQAKMYRFIQSQSETQNLKMRIGLHSGEVTVEAAKLIDVFGTNVNIASRVEGLAAGGQIYMTHRVYQDAKSYEASFKRKLIWQDHGLWKLKGITLPQRIYEVIETRFGSARRPTNGIKPPFRESRPPIDPNRIFGRTEELEEINEKLSLASCIGIIGIRGIGKSTLASMWVEKVEQKDRFKDIIWVPVYSETKLWDIVGGFFEAIGEPRDYLKTLPVQNQVASLLNKLNEQSYLLLLDGLETIVSAEDNQPKEEGISDLLHDFCRKIKESKVVLTSWEAPRGKYGIKPEIFVIQGIDEESGISLLRSLGVGGKENNLKEAVKRAGGHPIALQQLSQLVKGGRSLSLLLERDELWLGSKGEVAERLLNETYEERLTPEEQQFLKHVSILHKPDRIEALAAISKQELKDAEKVAASLVDKARLNLYQDFYYMHSLIQRNAYNKIKTNEMIRYHQRAVNYYLQIPIPEREKRRGKDDILPLIEVCHHACAAKDYEQAYQVILDNKLHEDLRLWGESATLLELCKGIPEKPCPLPREKEGVLFNTMGNVYVTLSQFKKAIEYYKQALIIAREIGDQKHEGRCLGNLGLAYRNLGQFKKAIEYFELGLNIAREIGDRENEALWLGNLGAPYSNLGQCDKAIEYYQQALNIARVIGEREGEGTWLGEIGTVYNNLGQCDKAIEYYQQALNIAREIGDRENEALWLGNLGGAYGDLGQFDKEIEYSQHALDIARENGDRQQEGSWLGNFGVACHNLKQFDKAIEYFQQALDIARESGDRQMEGRWLGNLGVACHNLKQFDKAIEYFQQALDIAKDIGSRELEGHSLGNLGAPYSNLGQFDKAIWYFQQALDIARNIGDRLVEGEWLKLLGAVYTEQAKYDLALSCLLQSQKIRKEIKDLRLKETEENIAKIKTTLGETKFQELIRGLKHDGR